MDRKRFLYGILALFLIVAISGCGTAKKKVNLTEEVGAIKTKLDTVEAKLDTVESRQADAERMASEQAQTLEELKSRRSAASSNISVSQTRKFRSTERVKDIQVCLKNAGFYTGKIDGRKGRGTRRAIRAFQRQNGLHVDGVVGPRTWELLSKYMNEAAAPQQAAVSEEGATK